MKNNKTNIVGYAALVFLLLAIGLVYFDKATLDQVTQFGTLVALGLIYAGFKMSKDHNK